MNLLWTRERIIVLFAMTCSISLVFLNATLLPIALPTIERELLVSKTGLQWIINSYLLSTASFVIAGGRMGDLLGHRRIFCLGMGIYVSASIMGGLAYTGWWLILSRAIQGFGGAMMSPSAISILVRVFPDSKRGKAIGIMVAIGSLFLSLGPFIGGAFTQLLSWRWSFWCNLPIALLGIFLTRKAVPVFKTIKERFDFVGLITTSSGLFCITLALMQGKSWGWLSPVVVTLFVMGILFLIAARFCERFVAQPFFDFNLFKKRVYLGGTILIFCSQFIMMITVFWPMYFQKILGYEPIVAGLYTAIATLPLLIVAPISGVLSDRFGARIPIMIGFSLIVLCFLWFAYFSLLGNMEWLIPALLAFGAGMAFVMTPAGSASIGAVPHSKTGIATGMYNMMRFTGATIGVAIFGSIQTNIQEFHFRHMLYENHLTRHLDPSKYEGFLSSIPSSIEAMKQLDPATAKIVKEALYYGSTLAFSYINLAAGAVGFLALIVGIIFFKSARVPKK